MKKVIIIVVVIVSIILAGIFIVFGCGLVEPIYRLWGIKIHSGLMPEPQIGVDIMMTYSGFKT